MKIIDKDIAVWGDPIDGEAVTQIIRCRKTAVKAAMMADHHKGYSVPIGGVVAYQNAISPSGVGFDIACGNKAVLTDADPVDVKSNIGKIMDDIVSNISFGIGRTNEEKVEHPLFESPAWKLTPASHLKDLAAGQLGTVGSGNHFVDIFIDELKRIWVGCHFGSRGLGHKIATYFLKEGGATDNMDAPPLVISTGTPLGEDYIQCMRLAGEYAYAGRDWVCNKVLQILGAKEIDSVHNHHNFAWLEMHNSRFLWVVRKGATPLFNGQQAFVGGSMGDISVIIEGVNNGEDDNDNSLSLNSTIHGAGRVMSRTQAAGKMNHKTHERSGGAVTKEAMMEWVERVGVTLRGADTDESPQAYKRLPEVLRQQGDSIKIMHTLTPIGVAMAGRDIYDPYKD